MNYDEFRQKTSNIRPRQFETLIAEMYERLDWYTMPTPEQNDGGFDVYLERDGTVRIVEVKQRSYKVGVDTVRNLAGAALQYEDVFEAELVTNHEFTSGAEEAISSITENCENNNLTVESTDYADLYEIMYENKYFDLLETRLDHNKK